MTYRSETWTICKSDRTRITANEMKFLRSTAGYTELDKKINTEILRELKINWVLEHIAQYRNNWKQHLQRMDRSRVPQQMMTYRPKGKRSLERPLKRWSGTVTGHWGLIRVRKKKRRIKYKCNKLNSNNFVIVSLLLLPLGETMSVWNCGR
jgi:hypothetical protein